MEKWKPLRASHFSTPPTAAIRNQRQLRYTNTLTGTNYRAGQTYRYEGCQEQWIELRMRMREIAQTRVCYGYRKIRVLLNREGWNVGKDLVYRLYKEEGLVRLKSHDSWMKIIFFIRTNESLEGKTPMEALRLGMIEEVAQVARVFGEQDAV